MTTRVQTLRSSVTGNRPAPGTRQPGELYVNFPDQQIGFINPNQARVDLLPVRFFNVGANYAVGDFVAYSGQIYRCKVAQTPATAWVAADWDQMMNAISLAGYLPLSGGTLTGELILAADPTNALDAATKHYVDQRPAGITDAPDSQNYLRQAGVWVPQQSSLPGGFLNRLRNGAMNVWQRGISALSCPAATVTYTADGWIITPTGAAVTAARAAGRGPSLYGLQITGAAGVTALTVGQRVESYFSTVLGGNVSVTFQVWIYNNTGAAITPQLQVMYATAQDNFLGVGSVLAASNLQSCPNGAWTRVAYTLQATTAQAQAGLQFNLLFGATVNGAAKTVIVTEADVRVTPGLQVGLNISPPPAEFHDIATEMLLSSRYYLASAAAFAGMFSGNVTSGVTYYAFYPLPDQLRAVPTSAQIKLTTVTQSGFPANVGTVANISANGFSEARAANAATNGGYFGSSYTVSVEL